MELEQVIYNRRSVRSFLDKEVPVELINKLIDAAQWAPSACNKQCWKFVVVNDAEVKDAIVKKAGANPWMAKAPVLIVVLYEKNITVKKSSYIQSAAAAAQNIILRAYDLGLGATWMAGLGDLEKVKEILHVPETYHVIAGIVVGYGDEVPMTPKRRDVSEIMSFNSFNFPDAAYPYTYDVKKWNLKKIIKFREDSLCAASPIENNFRFGYKSELKNDITFATENLKEDDKILEIMPFSGTHTVEMLKAKPFKNYHVYELSQQPLDYVKKKLENNEIDLPVQYNYSDPNKLPYEDNYFDSVLVFQKLENLPNLEILKEITRVLKPGGELNLSFKNMLSMYGLYYLHKFKYFNKRVIWNYGPFIPLNYFKVKKILQKDYTIKDEIGITPLNKIGKLMRSPWSAICRIVTFRAIKK